MKWYTFIEKIPKINESILICISGVNRAKDNNAPVYSTSELKVYENSLKKNKFDYNLFLITRISRDMEKCIYYHGFNEHEDMFNSTPDIPNDENCGDDY